MPGLRMYKSSYYSNIGANEPIGAGTINIGCLRGRGSTTRMFAWCKQNSPNPSGCINQFVTFPPTTCPQISLSSIATTNDDGTNWIINPGAKVLECQTLNIDISSQNPFLFLLNNLTDNIFNNYGTINFNSPGGFFNVGTNTIIYNYGTINMNNPGGSCFFGQSGDNCIIYNYGTINLVTGCQLANYNNNSSSTFYNNGTINGNSSSIYNQFSTFNNNGKINLNNTSSITNDSNSTFNNNGKINLNNLSSITNENISEFNNNLSGTISLNNSSSINNTATSIFNNINTIIDINGSSIINDNLNGCYFNNTGIIYDGLAGPCSSGSVDPSVTGSGTISSACGP
jgi:hypothetical protein